METGDGKDSYCYGFRNSYCQQDFTVLFTSVPVLLTQIRKPNPQRHCGRCNYGLKNTIWLSVMNSDMSVVTRKEENCFLTTCPYNRKKATIITTNLAFNRWNEIIKDKVLVAAMVDRLTHKAYLVNMTGLSYRLKETQK